MEFREISHHVKGIWLPPRNYRMPEYFHKIERYHKTIIRWRYERERLHIFDDEYKHLLADAEAKLKEFWLHYKRVHAEQYYAINDVWKKSKDPKDYQWCLYTKDKYRRDCCTFLEIGTFDEFSKDEVEDMIFELDVKGLRAFDLGITY